ncbi:MAG: hypothetical protein DRN78_03945 [Thermoproteota archaeon]|nr:MAG: hypothetical protein DRN78_03945 [Candidatus Korarchaeota archaeon]
MIKVKARFKVQKVSTVTAGVIEEVTVVEKFNAENIVEAYQIAKQMAEKRTKASEHNPEAIKEDYIEVWKLKAVEMI